MKDLFDGLVILNILLSVGVVGLSLYTLDIYRLRKSIADFEGKLEKTTQSSLRILEILELLCKKMKEFEEKINE